MNDQTQTLHDDIAFMRALAQEGRSTPLLGGAILASAGGVYALASLVHWTIQQGIVAAGPWAIAADWVGATVIFFAVLSALTRRARGKPGAAGPANRATRSAWSGIGWAILVIWAAMALVSWRLGSAAPMLVFPSVILALYGAGWSVAARMSGRRGLWLIAFGSFGAALALAFAALSPHLFLIYAASLVVLAVFPGLALMRQEPSDTV